MIYVAKIKNGRCEIYNASNGCYVRPVGRSSGAVSAQVQGDLVSITYTDGAVEIYNASNGCYLRRV